MIERIDRAPVLRIGAKVLTRKFWSHLRNCRDGLCRIMLVYVELPLAARWLFLLGAGFAAPRGDYLLSALGIMIFVLLTTLGNMTGRYAGLFHSLIEHEIERGGIKSMVEQMLKGLGGSAKEMPGGMMIELPLGKLLGITPPEDESDIDRLIRESNAEYEKKNRGKKPPTT